MLLKKNRDQLFEFDGDKEIEKNNKIIGKITNLCKFYGGVADLCRFIKNLQIYEKNYKKIHILTNLCSDLKADKRNIKSMLYFLEFIKYMYKLSHRCRNYISVSTILHNSNLPFS